MLHFNLKTKYISYCDNKAAYIGVTNFKLRLILPQINYELNHHPMVNLFLCYVITSN